MKTKTGKLNPLVTPGEVLNEEFLVPMGLTKYRLAKGLHVTPSAIGQIIAGKRAITPEMALRLGSFFGTTALFWLNLQIHFDLERLERETVSRPVIERYVSVERGRERHAVRG